MKITKSKKGFTLTEILVVVLVIAVLAAIAYPMYTKAITKSKAVEAINLLQMVRNKQLQNFAKKGSYMEDFSKIGNLTIDAETQSLNPDGTIKINDYTLALNPSKNCMTATYQKGNTNFMFASSYETPGLGCTGSICTSFGDIVGSASDVCNCGSKTCSNNFELNPNTCACECNQCLSGGYCMAPTQTQSENRMCPDGKSMQSRTCTASCGGGDCGPWSPATCPVVKTACPATCQAGYKRDTSVSYSEDGACCIAKSACPSTCQAGYKRDTSVSYSEDGTCCVVDTTPSCNTTLQSDCVSSGGTFSTTGCTCTCPAGKSLVNGKCQCAADMQMRCVDSYFGPAGTVNTSNCSCVCPGGSVLDSSEGNCRCPSDKPTWDGSKCVAQATQCSNPSYAAANKCECDPNIYNCCTQDYGEARDTIFDYATRTCRCPDNMLIDGQAGCRCEAAYVPAHKSLCCPNEEFTNADCWTEASDGIWKYSKVIEDRDCGGSYSDFKDCGSNITMSGPSGQACSPIGATCKVYDCWRNSSSGSDWGDQYSGKITYYTCSGDSAYAKNGW